MVTVLDELNAPSEDVSCKTYVSKVEKLAVVDRAGPLRERDDVACHVGSASVLVRDWSVQSLAGGNRCLIRRETSQNREKARRWRWSAIDGNGNVIATLECAISSGQAEQICARSGK